MAYLRNNIGIPAEKGFVPPGMPSSTKNVKGYIYNSDKARDLLKDAGYENGIGLPEITLTTTGDYVDLCEFIQYQLSEVGIKINIDVASGGAFRGMVSNSKLEFFRGSWIADYPEAENYLSLFYSKNFSPNGPNYTHFASAEYDRLYQEVLKEQNPDKRLILYHTMDQIAIDEAVIVPLFYDEVVRLVQKRVQGLEPNPMNLLTLKNVKK